MNKDQGELFTVGKLAQKGGVTVRTLQYYDTSGLLVPSEYSEGGRRMYGRRDVIRLQQILFFKSLGFSLQEIRDRLLTNESVVELDQMFKHQKEVLIEQISHIEQVVILMDKVIDEVKLGSEISVDTLFAIMGSIKLGNPYSFMIRHFGKDQIENFFSSFENEDAAVELNKTVQALSTKLIELYKLNEDPEGAEGQKLADKWWEMVMLLTNGDPELIQNMFVVGAHEDNWPADAKDLKQATKLFLQKAMGSYLKKNNIKLDFMEGR